MSDDIVKHLRAVANDSVYRADISVSKLEEAADEIERLRAENETLKRLAFPRQNPEYRYFIHPDAVQDYIKVMRGER